MGSLPAKCFRELSFLPGLEGTAQDNDTTTTIADSSEATILAHRIMARRVPDCPRMQAPTKRPEAARSYVRRIRTTFNPEAARKFLLLASRKCGPGLT